MSSRLGRKMSHNDTACAMQAWARASGQSLRRRLESKDTSVPASRARRMASNAVSQACGEIASEMPDRCRMRAACSAAAGSPASHCGAMWLAAEPARR